MGNAIVDESGNHIVDESGNTIVDESGIVVHVLHIVNWLEWYRVMDERNRVAAVCETYNEAESYIAGQPA